MNKRTKKRITNNANFIAAIQKALEPKEQVTTIKAKGKPSNRRIALMQPKSNAYRSFASQAHVDYAMTVAANN